MGMIFILFVTIDGLEVDVKMLKPYLHPKPVDTVDGGKHTWSFYHFKIYVSNVDFL